jgi:flagellar biosynthesis GTPase FlhF
MDFSVHINNDGKVYEIKGSDKYTIFLQLKNSHYTLVFDSKELDFGQYNLASNEKNSGDDAHTLPPPVRDNYNNFLKLLGVVEKKGNCCFPKCLIMALFLKEFREKEEKAKQEEKDAEFAESLQKEEEKAKQEEKDAEFAESLQQKEEEKAKQEEKDAEFAESLQKEEEKAKLLLEEQQAKLAAKLAHSLDTQEYQELLQRKEKDQKMAKLLQEKENNKKIAKLLQEKKDAEFAKQLDEQFAKMGLSD